MIIETKSFAVIENGIEQESIGIDFCKSLYGADTEWVQTSYNGSFRSKYAGLGDKWDGENFVFPTIEGIN